MILRAKDREKINQIASDSFTSPIEIWAYGSRVNGDAHETSDLDLVVKPMNQMKWEELMNFKEGLQQSNIPILIDVMSWDKISELFQKSILENYEVLYSSG